MHIGYRHWRPALASVSFALLLAAGPWVDRAAAAPTVIGTASVGQGTHSLAVNPTTNRVYVTNQVDNTLSVIDGATNSTMATIAVGAQPFGVAVDPVRNRIYVVNAGSHNLVAIDGRTNTVFADLPAGTPSGVAVDSSTGLIYVTSVSDNLVYVFGGPTIATIRVGNFPLGVAANPNTHRIYVANQQDNSISVIDGTSNTLVSTLALGSQPAQVAVNPTTDRIYVSLGARLAVVDGLANTLITTVADNAFGVAVNPSTNRIYLGSGQFEQGLPIVDGTTDTVITHLQLPGATLELAVNPVTNRVYAGLSQSVAVVEDDGDRTTPTTTISLSPPGASGQNGWYTTPVSVSVSVSDPDNPAAALQTRCALDPTSPATSFANLPDTPCAYLSPGSTVTDNGAHTLVAASRDADGNTEAGVVTRSFKIDALAPVSTLAVIAGPPIGGAVPVTISGKAAVISMQNVAVGTPFAVTCWNSSSVNVALAATDTISGVSTLQYAVTGPFAREGDVVTTPSIQVEVAGPGRNTLTYAATDVAGNQETMHSETVVVGKGFVCAAPTPNFSVPSHGILIVRGTATTNGKSSTFDDGIDY